MMKGFILFILFIVALPEQTLAQDPIWFSQMKQVRLLADQRKDVLQRFGQPLGNRVESFVWKYDFKEGRLFLFFEPGKCIFDSNRKTWTGWKVPPWTLVGVEFQLYARLDPDRIHINLEDYKSEPVYDVANALEYFDKRSGISLSVMDGKIESLSISPAGDSQNLRCTEELK